MDERYPTTSNVISFLSDLEDISVLFYQKLAEVLKENSQLFMRFARESKSNKSLIVRTYRETVTDVLETLFSFSGLNLDYDILKFHFDEKLTAGELLSKAVNFERTASALYVDISNRSRSFLSTVPNVLSNIGKKRKERIPKLEELRDNFYKGRAK
ncbi:MAG: hypothetical protein QXO75_08255 [Nitrososphaerota archaeon]